MKQVNDMKALPEDMKQALSGKAGLSEYLKKGGDKNAVNIWFANCPTLLMSLVGEGKVEAAQFLIEAGADTLGMDDNGSTALMYAAAKGNESLTKSLIENGGMRQTDKNRTWTEMHSAVSGKSSRCLLLILKAGGGVEWKDDEGATPLHVACERGYSKMVRLLLRKGASVGSFTHDEETPLSICLRGEEIEKSEENKDCIKALIRNKGMKRELLDHALKCPTSLKSLSQYALSLWEERTLNVDLAVMEKESPRRRI